MSAYLWSLGLEKKHNGINTSNPTYCCVFWLSSVNYNNLSRPKTTWQYSRSYHHLTSLLSLSYIPPPNPCIVWVKLLPHHGCTIKLFCENSPLLPKTKTRPYTSYSFFPLYMCPFLLPFSSCLFPFMAQWWLFHQSDVLHADPKKREIKCDECMTHAIIKDYYNLFLFSLLPYPSLAANGLLK